MRSADDLHARARIRNAAVTRFGADGFGAGLRAIAADAGVSPALIVHHFGSKSALRKARSEEHTSELQSRGHLVCRLLLEKKKERQLGATDTRLLQYGDSAYE